MHIYSYIYRGQEDDEEQGGHESQCGHGQRCSWHEDVGQLQRGDGETYERGGENPQDAYTGDDDMIMM